MIRDFLKAAAPWIIMGVCLLYLLVIRKKVNDPPEETKNSRNYTLLFMVLGMTVGVGLDGTGAFGENVGLTGGMLLGLAVGSILDHANKKE